MEGDGVIILTQHIVRYTRVAGMQCQMQGTNDGRGDSAAALSPSRRVATLPRSSRESARTHGKTRKSHRTPKRTPVLGRSVPGVVSYK